MKKSMLLFLLVLYLLLAFAVGGVMAQFTVDFDATTTVMKSVEGLHINDMLDHILLGGIMLMQLLKYFFPKIDGK